MDEALSGEKAQEIIDVALKQKRERKSATADKEGTDGDRRLEEVERERQR